MKTRNLTHTATYQGCPSTTGSCGTVCSATPSHGYRPATGVVKKYPGKIED